MRNVIASVGLIGLLGCNEKEEVEITLPVHEIADVQLLTPPTTTPFIPPIKEKIDEPSLTEICVAVEKAKKDLLYDASLPQIGPVITELEEVLTSLGAEKRNELLKKNNRLTAIGFKPSRNGGAYVAGYNVLGPFNYGLERFEVITFNVALPGVRNSYNIEFSTSSGEPQYVGSEEFRYRNQEGSIKITKIRYEPAGRNGKDVYEDIVAVNALASGLVQPAVQRAFYEASSCDKTIPPEKQRVASVVLKPLVKLWNTVYKN